MEPMEPETIEYDGRLWRNLDSMSPEEAQAGGWTYAPVPPPPQQHYFFDRTRQLVSPGELVGYSLVAAWGGYELWRRATPKGSITVFKRRWQTPSEVPVSVVHSREQ